MNVLVTGATGFIGRTFISQLTGKQYNIFGLDIKGDQQIDAHRFFLQDITRPFHLEEPFDCVFHLAALNVTHVGKADQEAYHRANVQGTENLIKAVNTEKFVLMSTAKVYKKHPGIIDEHSEILPEGDYEKSKWLAEELCRKYLRPDQLVILRPVNIAGPGQAEKAILPVFFRNAVQNNPIDVFAPRDSVLQFVHIDDVIRLFGSLLKNNAASGVFNLSSSDRISLEELALKIVELTHSRSAVRFTNAQKAVFSEVVSLRAKEVLDWQAHVPIAEILRRYCADLARS